MEIYASINYSGAQPPPGNRGAFAHVVSLDRWGIRNFSGAFRQLMRPHPREFAHFFKKMLMREALAFTKASSFPINSSIFWKDMCQMPGGRPGVR